MNSRGSWAEQRVSASAKSENSGGATRTSCSDECQRFLNLCLSAIGERNKKQGLTPGLPDPRSASSLAQSRLRIIAATQAHRNSRSSRCDDLEMRRAPGIHPGARANEKPAESRDNSTLLQLSLQPGAETHRSNYLA